jgi:hypothetical protein
MAKSMLNRNARHIRWRIDSSVDVSRENPQQKNDASASAMARFDAFSCSKSAASVNKALPTRARGIRAREFFEASKTEKVARATDLECAALRIVVRPKTRRRRREAGGSSVRG